jgi:hypothetical protein
MQVKRKQTVFMASGLIMAFLWTYHLLMGSWGIEIHRCEGDSMQPTLGDGAVYVIRKAPQKIHIGDIVTARVQSEGAIYQVVKRVVDMDGQRVAITIHRVGKGGFRSQPSRAKSSASSGKVTSGKTRASRRNRSSHRRRRSCPCKFRRRNREKYR